MIIKLLNNSRRSILNTTLNAYFINSPFLFSVLGRIRNMQKTIRSFIEHILLKQKIIFKFYFLVAENKTQICESVFSLACGNRKNIGAICYVTFYIMAFDEIKSVILSLRCLRSTLIFFIVSCQ